MNERELADLFNSQWDAVQTGAAPRRGDTPAEVRQALEMAGKVAQSDFSTDSRSGTTAPGFYPGQCTEQPTLLSRGQRRLVSLFHPPNTRQSSAWSC
jgi:hypothetical protein